MKVFPSFFFSFLAALYPLPSYWGGISHSPAAPSSDEGTGGDAGMPPSYFQRFEVFFFLGCLVSWVVVLVFFLTPNDTPSPHLRAEDLSRPEQSYSAESRLPTAPARAAFEQEASAP